MIEPGLEGVEVAETLFPHVDPVDKEISLDGLHFRVIGVMERKGKFLNFNRDNLILIPMGSYARRDPVFNFLIADVKAASNAEGGRYTPCSSMAWKNRL